MLYFDNTLRKKTHLRDREGEREREEIQSSEDYIEFSSYVVMI